MINNYMDKIQLTEKILNDNRLRYLYLGSLISADNNFNEETCNQSLEKLNLIKDNIDKMDSLSESIKIEIINFVNKGLEILEEDINKYKN